MAALQLTPDQQRAMDAIAAGRSVLITGPAGTGKSAVVREALRRVASGQLRLAGPVVLTATTGIAATLLADSAEQLAYTIHSWAGIGLGDAPAAQLVERVMKSYPARSRWRRARPVTSPAAIAPPTGSISPARAGTASCSSAKTRFFSA